MVNWKSIGDKLGSVFRPVYDHVIKPIGHTISKAAPKIGSTFEKVFGSVTGVANNLISTTGDVIKSGQQTFGNLGNNIVNTAGSTLQSLTLPLMIGGAAILIFVMTKK
jgi:hypothetical protein